MTSRCADCGEDFKESERPAAVTCSCGAVLHAECRLSDPATAKDYCEPCYYSPKRQALAVLITQGAAEA